MTWIDSIEDSGSNVQLNLADTSGSGLVTLLEGRTYRFGGRLSVRLNIASASLTGGLIRSIRDNRSSMVLSAAADAGHALQDQVVDR
ncbi:MAG: hypothetical protein CMQ29_13795 [Gammaproteobacteria bacterium]|nr:hypothetical protein [Gammaproteobacteria bacterium]